METFTFTHPKTGEQIDIDGDRPPDAETLNKIFAETSIPVSASVAVDANQQGVGDAPEWAGKYPNVYAGVMTGLDTAAAGASLAKGTGLGMALGAGLNAGAQTVKRMINNEPTTGKALLLDATLGATAEGAGRGLSSFLGKFARSGSGGATDAALTEAPTGPVMSAVKGVKDFIVGGADNPIATPQALRNASTFKAATGLDMMPSDISRGKYTALTERVLKMDPITSNKMDLLDRQLVGGYSDKMLLPFLNKYGGQVGTQTAGIEALESMARKSKAVQGAATKLYDRSLDFVPDGTLIQTGNLATRAGEFFNQLSRLPESQQNTELMKILKDFAVNATEFDPITIKSIQSELGAAIKAGDSGLSTGVKGQSGAVTGVYKQLAKALDDDLSVYATANPEYKSALDLANKFYKDRVKGIFNAPAIRAATAQQPDQIVSTFFHRNNATNLETLKKAVGEPAFQKLKAAWLNSSLKVVDDGATTPYFNPKSLQQMLAKMDDDTLKTIFSGKDELKEITELAQIGNMLRGSEAIAGNPSGTAGNMIAYQTMNAAVKGGAGGLGGYMYGGGDKTDAALGAAAGIASPAVVAKMLLTKGGRRILTEGLTKGISTAARGGFDAALLGYTNPNVNRDVNPDPLGYRQ